ncbi:MAG: hypothetical protein ACOCQG_00255 [Candidatus Nanoarchaeia archaeon]
MVSDNKFDSKLQESSKTPLKEEVKKLENVLKNSDNNELNNNQIEQIKKVDIENLINWATNFEEELNKRDNTILAKEKELKQKEEEIKKREQEVDFYKKTWGEKKKEIEEMDKKLQKREEEIKKKEQEVDFYKETWGEKKKEIEEIDKELQSREEKIKKREQEITKKEKENEYIKSTLEIKRKEIEKKENQIKKEKEELEEKKKVINEHLTDARLLTKETSELREQISKKNSELEKQKQEVLEREKELKNREDKLNKKEEQINEGLKLVQEINHYKHIINDLRKTYEFLRQRVKKQYGMAYGQESENEQGPSDPIEERARTRLEEFENDQEDDGEFNNENEADIIATCYDLVNEAYEQLGQYEYDNVKSCLSKLRHLCNKLNDNKTEKEQLSYDIRMIEKELEMAGVKI